MYKDEKWSGRFSEGMSELVKTYTSSIGFDKRLWLEDIEGSLAHAKMLNARGILDDKDHEDIKRGLGTIKEEIQAGKMEWTIDKEDVHMNIEQRLIELVGDAGKRLHTGRSRNDQVATDVRLWLRKEIDVIREKISRFQKALVEVADANKNVLMPGFTHLQVAQPVSFAHHMLAYVEMFERDWERMGEIRARVNRLPLGAAALAGTTYDIDRDVSREALGFDALCRNSMDAVSDRDFAIEFTSAASIMMVHFSRLSEELVLWNSTPFSYVDIADRFCTGSSIMPQKKNPDVPELVRGKVGRVVGHLMGLIVLMKSQPLSYNKDNQEDKEPLFDTVDTLIDTLTIYTEMIATIKVKDKNMRSALLKGFATATDLADYLVKRGVPFRDSHEIVARAVKMAEDSGRSLDELSVDELKSFSDKVGDDVQSALTIEGSVNARDHVGGTALMQVERQIGYWKDELKARIKD